MQTIRIAGALAMLLLALGGCGGGGGSPVATDRPLDVQVATCGTLTALATDAAAGFTYAAGTVTGCEGATGHHAVYRVDAQGRPQLLRGGWESGFGPVGLTVDDAGTLNVLSYGLVGRIPSVLYRVDRSGTVIGQHTLPAALRTPMAARADGKVVVYGEPYDVIDSRLLLIGADGSTQPVHVVDRVLPPASFPPIDAQFGDVQGIALDAQGTIYVSSGSRVVRLSVDGILDYTWLEAQQAGFGWLGQLTIDRTGNLYVVDTGRNLGDPCVLRKLSVSGQASVVQTSVPVQCSPREEFRGGSGFVAVSGNRVVMANPTSWRVVSIPL